ncbi:thioredoxin family protein [Oscillospiraceae bacterium HV4-5-C5C]|nr:thioredoxin family protein [Oscillospiraceae bacterium HV4-5-C5C]
MKDVLYFKLANCPHCRLADRLIKELSAEDPRYADIKFKIVDEQKEAEMAEKYDYYYVPCFFIDGKKVSEGHVEKADMKKVLDLALEG